VHVWTTHEINLAVLITVQNLVGTRNRRNSFDNMQAKIFNEFGSKMPINAPNGVFFVGWGDFTPKWE